MSSWRTWDTDEGWDGLDQVDNGLLTAVKQVYHSILQFDGAFEDQRGAEDTVRELLAGNRASHDLARISAGLWEWKQRRCRRPAAAKRLASGLDILPGKFLRGGVSSASIFEDLVAGSAVLGITQLEKALKARKGTSQRREDQEAALRERWALELAGHIQDAKLPCATRIEAITGGKQAWCRAFGSRRGKTLQNRARAWGSFKAWLTISYGLQWPTDSGQILRYLEERHTAAPLGKSVPNGLMAALSLLETVGMVAPDRRMADDRLLVESVRSWTTELENGAAPVKSAPMMTVSVILACELLVCSPSYPDGMRYMAFVLLIMIWASLRADDTQNIEPVSVRLSQIGLRFVLKRTKTSGAGRKVGELHAFISRVAGLSGYDWLLVGMRLHEHEEFSWNRDFLCPVFSMNWEADSRAYLDPQGLALQIRRLLQGLHVPLRRKGVARNFYCQGRWPCFTRVTVHAMTIAWLRSSGWRSLAGTSWDVGLTPSMDRKTMFSRLGRLSRRYRIVSLK